MKQCYINRLSGDLQDDTNLNKRWTTVDGNAQQTKAGKQQHVVSNVKRLSKKREESQNTKKLKKLKKVKKSSKKWKKLKKLSKS